MKYNRSVENTYKGLYEIQLLNTYIFNLETSARGYMLTRDSVYLQPFENHRFKIKEAIDSLTLHTSSEGDVRNKLAMIHSTLKLRLSTLYLLINKASNQDTTSQSEALFRSKAIMTTLQQEIQDLVNEEQEMLIQNFVKKKFYENITSSYLKIVLFFTCFIFVTSFYFLNRSLRQRLRYQKDLEINIEKLHRSNEELEQLAHVASHDLQEPLRKLRTFSSRLLLKHSGALDEEVKLILARVEASVVNMQDRINDVVTYTNIIQPLEKIGRVELNEVLLRVIAELGEELKTKNVLLRHDILPPVTGYARQLYMMFMCLLDNSLKFSRQGVTPQINIRVSRVNSKHRLYHKIIVEDNGIGFDNRFNEKIFILFQRLHNQQSGFVGRGIGLSIVKRIVINHKGTIVANGIPEQGTIFTIFIPVE
ncbi:MAG: ATP-binding protein [Chitinophagaceae bacterium]